MKKWPIFFLFLAPAAQAGDWTTIDTQVEATYLVFHALDWGQTRVIASNPEEFRETNRVLGKHPSVRAVDTYFLATGLLHIGIAYVLSPKYRHVFQYVSIGIEVSTTIRNNGLGIKIAF